MACRHGVQTETGGLCTFCLFNQIWEQGQPIQFTKYEEIPPPTPGHEDPHLGDGPDRAQEVCRENRERLEQEVAKVLAEDPLGVREGEHYTIESCGEPHSFYFFGSDGQLNAYGTLPDPPFSPPQAQTIAELRREREEMVEALLDSHPESTLAMLYKVLYARGLRISTIDGEITRALEKELKGRKS